MPNLAPIGITTKNSPYSQAWGRIICTNLIVSLLAEKKHNWRKSTLGVSGNLGLRLRLLNSFNLNLFLKQTNLIYTSIGMGLHYSL